MKTTKRILALITALVLCLAPMALMVGAAVTNEVCEHYQYVDIIEGTLVSSTYIGTDAVCYRNVYENSYYACQECGHEWTGTYVKDIAHAYREFSTYLECWRCNHHFYK